MTVVGIGLDLIDLNHFPIHYGDYDPDLLARCFTQTELRRVGDGVDRPGRFAARLAVKEAVYKALGGGEDVAHVDIEVVDGPNGAPGVALHGAAKAMAEAVGAPTLLISLTHSATAAAAVVIAVSGQ